MEWLVDTALAVMFALCVLSMLRMMLRGLVRGSRHGGHGTMMCMDDGAYDEPRRPGQGRLDELKVERNGPDALIARADREPEGREGPGEVRTWQP